MVKSQVASICAAVGLVIPYTVPSPTAAQPSPSPGDANRVQKVLLKGVELRLHGHFVEALNAFKEAEKEASLLGDQSTKAEVMFQAAQTHETIFTRDPAQLIHVDKAIVSYQSAVRIGSPELRTQAQNNLGSLYLKKRDYSSAVRTLEEVDPTQILPAEKFIYDYNLGRAYDLSGHPNTAYPNYLRSLGANPTFSPAAEKAFESLRRSEGPPKIDESLRLADLLLRHSQSNLASQERLRCLEIWGDNPSAERLLTVLVRHYAITSLDPDAFVKDEWRPLDNLASRHHRLRSAVTEVRLAFTGDFKAVIQAPLSGPVQPFPEWWRLERNVKPGERDFPKLLNNIGDFYYQSVGRNDECRDPVKAISRYTAALSLDPYNTRAALFTSAILRDYYRKLDPAQELFNQLMDVTFHSGGIYEKTSKAPADWANLVRMHFLLGSIFERAKVRGSEDDPRSAIFQWNRAIVAENKLRELDRNYPPTPGLHQSLATAYKVANEPGKAFEQFLSAGRGVRRSERRIVGEGSLSHARGGLMPHPDRFTKNGLITS